MATDHSGTLDRDPYPTPDELQRLAIRARENGIRIEGPADRPQAFDPRGGGRTFDLTAISCTCRLFVVGGACQHHALLTAPRR